MFKKCFIFSRVPCFFIFQMPEEQAFCLFMKILKDYGHRNLFKDNFEQLHQRFYIIERLMEVFFMFYHDVQSFSFTFKYHFGSLQQTLLFQDQAFPKRPFSCSEKESELNNIAEKFYGNTDRSRHWIAT